MRIEHVAMWSKDLERLKRFYVKNFGAVASAKYKNERTGFESYFLSFEEGCRLEIMALPALKECQDPMQQFVGLAHLAIQASSREMVVALTETLRQEGITVVGEPRTTGDGYFESLVLDPDGNRVEITA